MLSSNMLLPNLIPLIDVTFSTPTPDNRSCRSHLPRLQKKSRPDIGRLIRDIEFTGLQCNGSRSLLHYLIQNRGRALGVVSIP